MFGFLFNFSTKSGGSRRELVANSIHTTRRRRDSTRQLSRVVDIIKLVGLEHLQAFQFNKSGDESFFEFRGGSDGCQRPPVELTASKFSQMQRPRCL